jgi:hypothetical protein
MRAKMRTTSRFILPYEPQYTGHRTAEEPSKDIMGRLRHSQHDVEQEVASPSIAAEPAGEDEKIK